MILISVAALLSLVVFAKTRGGSKPVDYSATEIRVQAALYSGLPNPQWILPAGPAGECAKLLAELPVSKLREPQRGLGYSGLRLELVQTRGHILGFRVHDGGVWVEGAKAVSYVDSGSALELWLIATASVDVQAKISRGRSQSVGKRGQHV